MHILSDRNFVQHQSLPTLCYIICSAIYPSIPTASLESDTTLQQQRLSWALEGRGREGCWPWRVGSKSFLRLHSLLTPNPQDKPKLPTSLYSTRYSMGKPSLIYLSLPLSGKRHIWRRGTQSIQFIGIGFKGKMSKKILVYICLVRLHLGQLHPDPLSETEVVPQRWTAWHDSSPGPARTYISLLPSLSPSISIAKTVNPVGHALPPRECGEKRTEIGFASKKTNSISVWPHQTYLLKFWWLSYALLYSTPLKKFALNGRWPTGSGS